MINLLCSLQVIAAEGEQKASRALRDASNVIADTPAALQLRYLQVNNLSHPKTTLWFLDKGKCKKKNLLAFSDVKHDISREKLDHRLSIANRHSKSHHETQS